jgi:solute carrier family 25 (mitochondrial carnitine/acylcarnitine transporter), member 20/29
MKDIVASFWVGVGQLVVGHPFDTIKVCLQNKTKLPPVSISNYYKGWKFPFAHSLFYNISCFTIHERSYKHTNNHFISGMIGGACISPITYISDTFKIKYQLSNATPQTTIPHTTTIPRPICTPQPIHTLSPIIKQAYSQIKTTQGLASLASREILASGIYFSTFHKLKTYIDSTLICGGLTGITSWTLTYPIDAIMSRQIAQNISVSEAIKQKNLWKGYTICIQRAMIVNAINFKIYDTLMNDGHLSFLDDL